MKLYRRLAVMSTLGYPAADIVGPAVIHGEFRRFYLSVYANHWILILFYPCNFPLVNADELRHLCDRYNDFFALDCALVGVTTESHYSTLAYVKSQLEDGCPFPLVSDKTQHICREYETLNASEGVAEPCVVVVNPQGLVTLKKSWGLDETRPDIDTLYDMVKNQIRQSNT